MTQQNTMPDEIWADSFNDWYSRDILDEDPIGFKRTKYIRADLHTDLLKQARHYLDGVARDAYDNRLVCEIIHNIDKVLGEQNVT